MVVVLPAGIEKLAVPIVSVLAFFPFLAVPLAVSVSLPPHVSVPVHVSLTAAAPLL